MLSELAAIFPIGIIALMLEARPHLTPFQIKTILYAIAKRNEQAAAQAGAV